MTVKVVVLYGQPDDPAGFEQHYLGTHAQLVSEIPGLERAEAGLVTRVLDGGEQTYYRIAEQYFADADAMRAGLRSPQAQAVAADFGKIAPPGSRMMIVSLDE